jgi:colanic acid biosynthesis glycosyl transferase WcaI
MKLLLLNQTYAPDVVSTAQHAHDFASHMAMRGHHVTALTSAAVYGQVARRHRSSEGIAGVRVIRVPTLALGKAGKLRRTIDALLFFCLAALVTVVQHRQDAIVCMTSPPMLPVLGVLLARVRRTPIALWLMDLNPDEAVAARYLDPEGWVARALESASARALRAANLVVVLDRFMRERVERKGVDPGRIATVPPWSHDEDVHYSAEGRREFRLRYGIQDDQYVLMYSGNHSPCHPLATVIEAADRLRDDRRFVFCFVGAGEQMDKVKSEARVRGLSNVLTLSYVPRSALAGSLSAADGHLVVMGDAFVGIVHPCKVYNVLALGIPLLFVGPADSHVSDIYVRSEGRIDAGFVRHGDVQGIVNWLAAGHRRNVPSSEDVPRDATAFAQSVLVSHLAHHVEGLCASAG